MVITFLAVIVVMIIINAFMIFVLRKICVKVDKELSILCIRGMSALEVFNEQKSEEEEVVAPEETAKARILQMDFVEEEPLETYHVKPSVVYKNIDFLREYKAVKYAMQIDKSAIVQRFIGKYSKGFVGRLQAIESIINRYSFDLLFKIAALDETYQLEIIKETLLRQEQSLLEDYLAQCDQFECIDFMYYLQKEFYKYDDTIYIRTGEAGESFDRMDNRIKTIYDPGICEGLKIIYNNRLYDYSI